MKKRERVERGTLREAKNTARCFSGNRALEGPVTCGFGLGNRERNLARLFVAVHEVLRHYRALISHAQNI
jgi:hypothetical protein